MSTPDGDDPFSLLGRDMGKGEFGQSTSPHPNPLPKGERVCFLQKTAGIHTPGRWGWIRGSSKNGKRIWSAQALLARRSRASALQIPPSHPLKLANLHQVGLPYPTATLSVIYDSSWFESDKVEEQYRYLECIQPQ